MPKTVVYAATFGGWIGLFLVLLGLLWWHEAPEWYGAVAEPPVQDTPEQQASSLRLSPQARANLGLQIEELRIQNHWRTLQMPGMIIDRPGESDQSVPAPIAGVVTRLFARPGDTVRPGDALLTLKITSESLQNSQTELLKLTQELEIIRAELARYQNADLRALSPGRLIELEYQRRRTEAAIHAQKQDLTARGLTAEQIERAAAGAFLNELVVKVPGLASSKEDVVYEIEELRVNLGDQVQAGESLCVLADHRWLYIEGRALPQETELLQEVARQRRPIRVESMTAPNPRASGQALELPIHFIANKLNRDNHFLRFYLLLANEPALEANRVADRPTAETGRFADHIQWRYRPGQPVRLYVPIEEFRDKFVVPATAVVRDGPDAYVFRANGDLLQLRSVHVLYQDRLTAVLEPATSDITAGNYIATNAAAALYRALKAQKGSDDHHHNHDHH